MLIEARQIATKRMADDAEALGADAVVYTNFNATTIYILGNPPFLG